MFLDTIVSMEDVWVVTAWQAIQWMRHPTPLEDIETFKPFQCDYKVRMAGLILKPQLKGQFLPFAASLWH